HFSCTTSRENFPHQRILFTLSEGYLIYCDQRKFGRFRYLEPEQKNQCLCELGVDPLSREYTFDLWNALLSSRKEKIKSFLMNQKYISGIGNIYASEILFRSGIHPEKRVDVLTEQEQKDLFRVIPEVLNQAIYFEGTTIRDYQHSDGTTGSFQDELLVYGKEGELCPVCGTPLERIKISSRSTYFCPICQNIKK
ncbi:MAG: zinc finger domain-containing protein, partial [Atribacterota bacterium]